MKFAICGTWHVHAGEYYQVLRKYGEVVGVYEENEQRRRAFCEHLSLPEYSSLDELLAGDADAVVVCSATNLHTDYIIKLAEAKKDIFSEKVLAFTLRDCDRIAEAVKANGVRFVISLPHKFKPEMLTIKSIVDSGELGKLNFVRVRNCHNGAIANWLPAHFYDKTECGGGAMIDLGAHGMYLIDWLLGMPDTYSSTFGYFTGKEVEDNAVTVMGYKNGAVGINETGFVSNGCPITIEVGGESGYLSYKKNAAGDAAVMRETAATAYKRIPAEMCEAKPLPIEQFAAGGVPEGCGLDEARRLTEMMLGAYNHRAAAE